MGGRSAGQNAGSGGEADEVLHPLSSVQFSERTTAIVGWAYVALVVAAAAWWSWLFSHPGGAHPLIALPTLLGLLALAAHPLTSLGGWFLARFGAQRRRMPRASLAAALVLAVVVVATWVGLPVRLRFEQHRADFDRLVQVIETTHRIDGEDASLRMDAEIPGYGTVVVTDVDGGLHVTVPHGGDRASHPGFAYLPTDAAATGASPELSLVRSLGGGWFEAELLAT